MAGTSSAPPPVQVLNVSQLPHVGKLGSDLYTAVSLAWETSLGELEPSQEITWPSHITYEGESTQLCNCQEDEDVGSSTSWADESQRVEAIKASKKAVSPLRRSKGICMTLRLLVRAGRHDGRAGRRLVPPPFSIIFDLDDHLADWWKLAKPRLLSEDEDGMKLLSLKKKTRSFFNKLDAIFGWGEWGVAPPQEEELASVPRACLRVKLILTRLDGGGKIRRGRERERGGQSLHPFLLLLLERERHSRKGDLPSKADSSILSHARQARSGAHKAPDSPPTATSSVPVATSQPVDSWPGWASAPPLDPGHSSRSLASRVEFGMTSAASASVASPANPATSISPTLKLEQKEMGASSSSSCLVSGAGLGFACLKRACGKLASWASRYCKGYDASWL
ncbi:hypothetical protein AMTR_s00200p00030510 [Amborella trichopoda]|uniref:Uncharacterized protein n=1 Tax=Amborella trichopoda TaxID=13333 RepID=W1NRC2_AMBTC|nr:hypothetical protein AMTR_s00200p00030510 [Amborella trichopoda]